MNDRLAKVLMVSSLADLLVGLALLGIGWSSDNSVLTIVGIVLAVMGAGALTAVVLVRDRPTRL